MWNRNKLLALVVVAISSVTGCSVADKTFDVFQEKGKVNYENNKSLESLKIPSDLSLPEFDNSLELPKGLSDSTVKQNTVVSAVPPQADFKSASTKVSSTIVKSGNKPALRVNQPYSKVLQKTKAVLSKLGFDVQGKTVVGGVITAKYNGENVSAEGETWKERLMLRFPNSNSKMINAYKALIKGEVYRISVQQDKSGAMVSASPVNDREMSKAARIKLISTLNAAFNK